MNDSDKRDHANTKPGVIRHSILGVIALAVAALDFTIGTKHVITAGIIALTVSVYSFTRAARLRTSTTKRDRPGRPKKTPANPVGKRTPSSH